MIPEKLRRQLEAANKLEWFENRVQELKDRNLLRETQAKAQALQELGPLPEVKDKPKKNEEDPEFSLIQSIQWVFRNMDASEDEWDSPPPKGARNMWAWARDDKNGRNGFFNQFIPKLAKDAFGKDSNKLEDDGRDQLELCNKLRAVVSSQSQAKLESGPANA